MELISQSNREELYLNKLATESKITVEEFLLLIQIWLNERTIPFHNDYTICQ